MTSPCPGAHLSRSVVVVRERDDEESTVYSAYPDPALEAELAYRRDVLAALGRSARPRRNPWLSRWRRRAD
ncbi:hypothetical protein [Trujillonella endophytica]|uniref:hypothetical protein n=1 Tax=Trujillonella endophytica TaxID=673521 RepID=UPI0011136ACF|nr:hypothetical protein [Trujillella endophytica]